LLLCARLQHFDSLGFSPADRATGCPCMQQRHPQRTASLASPRPEHEKKHAHLSTCLHEAFDRAEALVEQESHCLDLGHVFLHTGHGTAHAHECGTCGKCSHKRPKTIKHGCWCCTPALQKAQLGLTQNTPENVGRRCLRVASPSTRTGARARHVVALRNPTVPFNWHERKKRHRQRRLGSGEGPVPAAEAAARRLGRSRARS
jgi:hypothetical protein